MPYYTKLTNCNQLPFDTNITNAHKAGFNTLPTINLPNVTNTTHPVGIIYIITGFTH